MSKQLTLTQHISAPLTELQLKTGLLTHINNEDQSSSTSSWQIEKRLTIIGSQPNLDIALQDPTVSRCHAQLEVDHQGYRITDTQSKNGVYVNQTKVVSAFINDGDVISIGAIKLLFQLEGSATNFPLWNDHHFGELYGKSTRMRELFALLHRISQTSVNVLIEGESGTGKELAARAIHHYSDRSQAPFIVFDCSAVPTSLLESELFGHIKGAFTGATDKRQGAFLAANGGTLFIDEIGELPIDLQPKLLRVLERGELKAVGHDHYQKVDVRVLSATHRNLDHEVQIKKFRLDLFYRLAVVRAQMPALREHKEDIPGLVEELLEQLAPSLQKEISFKTMNLLLQHDWQGNVRELKNYVHRAIALSSPQSSHLNTQFLLPPNLNINQNSDYFSSAIDKTKEHTADLQPFTILDEQRIEWVQTLDLTQDFKEAKSNLISQFERIYWTALMDKNNGNISASARIAGIHRKSAEYIIKKLGLRSKDDV